MEYSKKILGNDSYKEDPAGAIRKLALDIQTLEEYHDVNTHNIWELYDRMRRLERLLPVLLFTAIIVVAVSVAALLIVHYRLQ